MKMLFLFISLTFSAFAANFWHKDNLYDKITLSYYIPYELWLQIPWDGEKKRNFNKVTSTEIQGSFNWYHPHLKKHLKVYKKTKNSQTELFTLYPKGIAKVFSQHYNTYFNNGLIFPAGHSWKIGKPYSFSEEIWVENKHYVRTIGIQIKEIDFKKNVLNYISYNYYINGKIYKTYTYRPLDN